MNPAARLAPASGDRLAKPTDTQSTLKRRSATRLPPHHIHTLRQRLAPRAHNKLRHRRLRNSTF